MMSFVSTALKGFAMGAANVVPGVSGGTVALVTGIYSDIVSSLNAFTSREVWKDFFAGRFASFWKGINGSFLIALCAGVLLSVFSLAKAVTLSLEFYPILVWAFFFGLIVASSVPMFRSVGRWSWKEVVFALAGAALGVFVCTMTPTTTPDSAWFLFVCGAIAICTMILPGISGSFVLLILCKYDMVMEAVSSLDWGVLGVFGAGCVVGILLFAKLLHALLSKWEKATMLVLLGFVMGSLVRVWPWADKAAGLAAQVRRGADPSAPLDLQIPGAVLCCIAGAALVAVLEFAGKKKK